MPMSTVSALAEARHTAYIRGRWVYSDSDGELQYQIVEPTLPSNGDYSAYIMWGTLSTYLYLVSSLAQTTFLSYLHWCNVLIHVDIYSTYQHTLLLLLVSDSESASRSPDAEMNQRNPAYTISSALSHTCQFVSVLAFYLDVILPRKQCYRYIDVLRPWFVGPVSLSKIVLFKTAPCCFDSTYLFMKFLKYSCCRG